MAKSQDLESVVSYLKRKRVFLRSNTLDFGILLYRYLDQIKGTPLLKKEGTALPRDVESRLRPEPLQKEWIIHVCCWGERYLSKAQNYLLPSLCADDNLPYLANNYHITLMIHCDDVSKQKLIQSPVVKNLQQLATIEFYLLPKNLLQAYQKSTTCYKPWKKRLAWMNQRNKYLLLGGLQHHALSLALQRKAYISFMMPDFLLSADFFKQAFSNMQDKIFAATTTFRTNYSAAKQEIHHFFDEKKPNMLSIESEALVSIEIKHMHEAAKRRVVSADTLNFSASAQIIFEDERGFIIRSFHYHPILMNCCLIDDSIVHDYMPIDFNMLNQIVSHQETYEKQCWICDKAADMAILELSDDDIETTFKKPRSLNEIQLAHEIKKVLDSLTDVMTPLNRYFASIRHRVNSHAIPKKQVKIPDTIFFEKLTDCTPEVDRSVNHSRYLNRVF